MRTVLRLLIILFSGVVPLLAAPGASFTKEKLVIAHYMTDMVPQTNRKLIRWIDPELADPNGSTAAMGGIQQTVPMASLHLKKADLKTAVDFEIRAARHLGLDGFQFYYPLGDNVKWLGLRYHEIIREFIRVSDEKYPGFRISICLAHPASQTAKNEKERIALWAPLIRKLLDETGDSPAWLRTDSGALLFFLWVGDAMADGVQHLAQTPDQVKAVGMAYQRFAEAVGTPIEFNYQVRRKEKDPRYINAVLETFPAVWGWTASEEDEEFWDYLARRCESFGTAYTQTVYPDYYTSKVYKKGEGYRNVTVKEALEAKPDDLERHYRVTGLSRVQRQLFEKAVERKAVMINYATWNDYPEGHHLAPEMNRNFGPALLLRHYKALWKMGGDAKVGKDQAIVFFKRHAHDARPRHAMDLHIKSESKDVVGEDRIELVTLLKEPAEAFLNGRAMGRLGQGLQTVSIPLEPGKVKVRLVRDGTEIIAFETPVVIEGNPVRLDRMTYSFSSEFEEEMKFLFPDVEP